MGRAAAILLLILLLTGSVIGILAGAKYLTDDGKAGSAQDDTSTDSGFVLCRGNVYVTRGDDCPGDVSAQQSQPTSQQPTTSQTNTTSGQSDQSTSSQNTADEGLPPSTVKGWCSDSCSSRRFEQLTEGNGFLNPRAVHFKSGNASAFDVPAGIFGEGWDCQQSFSFEGPTHLDRVCEASFRLS